MLAKSLLEGGERVELRLKEVFSGPMLFMIAGSLPDMTEAFNEFVRGLKVRAEAGS